MVALTSWDHAADAVVAVDAADVVVSAYNQPLTFAVDVDAAKHITYNKQC